MNNNDIDQALLTEITSATTVMARCPYEGDQRAFYTVGVLTSLLSGMAGQGELTTHQSCFSSAVTEAIRELLTVLNQK